MHLHGYIFLMEILNLSKIQQAHQLALNPLPFPSHHLLVLTVTLDSQYRLIFWLIGVSISQFLDSYVTLNAPFIASMCPCCASHMYCNTRSYRDCIECMINALFIFISLQGSNLKGKEFNLTMHWHIMPKTGKMFADKIVMTGYRLPEQYRQSERS